MNNKEAIEILEIYSSAATKWSDKSLAALVVEANKKAIKALKLEGIIVAILFAVTALACYWILLCIADKVY